MSTAEMPVPRKQINILLINPNATPAMTAACMSIVLPTLPPDVTVTPFTAPRPAPLAIESALDGVMSGAATLRALHASAEQYDAFLVACFSEHPLINMLREEFSRPAVGIMEAAFGAARTLGGRVGILATGARARFHGEDGLRHYGVVGNVGAEHAGLGVLDIERLPEGEVMGRMVEAAGRLVGRGADVITLGCAGMTRLKPVVEEAVGPDVQVVDGVLAGVHHLIGLVRMGGRTAKAGVWASSSQSRMDRGQDYL